MDMKRFLSKLRNEIGFHLDGNHTGKLDNKVCDIEEDVMCDDYVLVDSKTSAGMSNEGLPSYTCVMNEPYQQLSPPTPALLTSSSLTASSQDRVDCNVTSAVGDVPFQLHSILCGWQGINNIFYDLDLQIHHFNQRKYEYDFSGEKLCLRDLN